MDLSDEGQEYRVVVELPGVRREGVEIGPGPIPGTVRIKAEGADERNPTLPLRQERGVRGKARYDRVVPVAWDADVAQATHAVDHGVLTLTVPKQRPPEKPEK